MRAEHPLQTIEEASAETLRNTVGNAHTRVTKGLRHVAYGTQGNNLNKRFHPCPPKTCFRVHQSPLSPTERCVLSSLKKTQPLLAN